jgi:hypothetical protein
MHRLAQLLALDVPQRLVNPADRRVVDDPTPPEILPVHHLPQMLNPPGVLPNQQYRQVLHRPHHALGLPLQRRLTPSVKPRLVRLDLDKNPVAHPRMNNFG